MKVLFSFIFCALGLCYALHTFFFKTQNDYAKDQAQIEKESVESAVAMANHSANLDPALNKNLANDHPSADGGKNERAPSSVAAHDEAFTSTGPDGRNFWCRPTKNQVDPGAWTCAYPGACFQCVGSQVIIPEVADADPFCGNGTRAAVQDVVCCAHPSGGNTAECPGLAECYQSVDSTECACKAGGHCSSEDGVPAGQGDNYP